nr:hypothetical protein BaRGS_030898 [Batillaria attramentaria]
MDFLQGNGSYVSTAMDNTIGIKYGTRLCIPELNTKYRRLIRFEMVDTGSAFRHKGYSRIDVCVRTLLDTFDKTINGPLTLVFH